VVGARLGTLRPRKTSRSSGDDRATPSTADSSPCRADFWKPKQSPRNHKAVSRLAVLRIVFGPPVTEVRSGAHLASPGFANQIVAVMPSQDTFPPASAAQERTTSASARDSAPPASGYASAPMVPAPRDHCSATAHPSICRNSSQRRPMSEHQAALRASRTSPSTAPRASSDAMVEGLPALHHPRAISYSAAMFGVNSSGRPL